MNELKLSDIDCALGNIYSEPPSNPELCRRIEMIVDLLKSLQFELVGVQLDSFGISVRNGELTDEQLAERSQELQKKICDAKAIIQDLKDHANTIAIIFAGVSIL